MLGGIWEIVFCRVGLPYRQGGADEDARGLASGVLAVVERNAFDDVAVLRWGPGEEASAELPPVGGQAAGSSGVTGRVPGSFGAGDTFVNVTRLGLT